MGTVMTVTSNTVKWVIQSFRVVGMGIKIIIGENAMWEPERVNLLRDRGVLHFTERGFQVPFIHPCMADAERQPASLFT